MGGGGEGAGEMGGQVKWEAQVEVWVRDGHGEGN